MIAAILSILSYLAPARGVTLNPNSGSSRLGSRNGAPIIIGRGPVVQDGICAALPVRTAFAAARWTSKAATTCCETMRFISTLVAVPPPASLRRRNPITCCASSPVCQTSTYGCSGNGSFLDTAGLLSPIPSPARNYIQGSTRFMATTFDGLFALSCRYRAGFEL
jgi:hypothetical protein